MNPYPQNSRQIPPPSDSAALGAGARPLTAAVLPGGDIAIDRPEIIVCRYCGQEHRAVPLRLRQRALCTRCHSVLALGSAGRRPALAWALAGMSFVVPALMLPFASVDKLGHERVQHLLGGSHALWQQGRPLLGSWVLICGLLAPACLLALVAAMSARNFLTPHGARLAGRFAAAVEHWAMPEVQVLAVLIAMTKLGTLVNVHLGAGFWCYAAMALALLVSWRKFELRPVESGSAVNSAGTTP